MDFDVHIDKSHFTPMSNIWHR